MRRVLSVATAAVILCGAKSNDATGFLLLAGVAAALLVLLGLPLGVALHTYCRPWVVAGARAIERRATACVLIGAVVLIATVFALALVTPRAPVLGVMIAAAAIAWFYAGFAGCALYGGERMTGTAPGDASMRPLLLGWFARAGLFAVPVLWPLIGCYLLVAALGAPVVALLEPKAKPDIT